MILLLDNYDSFTWNLWHFLSDLGAEVKTLRNDAASVDEVMAMGAEGIVLSPGPGTPAQAGITEGLVRVAAGRLPILGVCLGHQAIWTAFGGSLMRVDPPMHGKLSRLTHERTGLFAGLQQDLTVTRYHSLVADEATQPEELQVTARTADGKIMGLQHKSHPIFGVQFHPESIASSGGYQMLAAFLASCGANHLPDEAKLDLLEAQLLRLDQKFPDQVHV